MSPTHARAGAIMPRFVAPAAGGSYSTEVLADTPLAYYRLGDASGTTMTDSSGNSRNGTYVGSPTLGATGLLAGDSNTAMALDGTAKYGNVTAASWMNTGTALTVECLIKPADSGRGQAVLTRADFNTSFGSTWCFYLYKSTANKILARLFTSTTNGVDLTSTTALSVGSIYHVAMTWDGTTERLYINGTQEASTAIGGTLNAGLTFPIDFVIGAEHGGNQPERFSGTIDEVAYYGTALSGTRIAAHHTAAI